MSAITSDARRRGRGATATILGAGLVAGMLLAAFAAGLARPGTGPRAGDAAPAFEVVTFEERTVRLSDLRGQVVVLNFWASWCVECTREAAELERIWTAYRERGVIVLGIDYTDTRGAALAYLRENGVTYPNAPDRGGAVSRAYRISGVPETFVIDATGRIVGLATGDGGGLVPKLIGPIVDGGLLAPRELRRLLERLVADAGGA